MIEVISTCVMLITLILTASLLIYNNDFFRNERFKKRYFKNMYWRYYEVKLNHMLRINREFPGCHSIDEIKHVESLYKKAKEEVKK